MSFVDVDEAREVHVTRLQHWFNRAGITAWEEKLKTLQLLREAEELEKGYWVPAPTRKVDLGGAHCLLIGVHPTTELRRHFSSVRRAGAARVIDADETVDLLKQSTQAWRGYDGLVASIWAQTVIESARQQFAPSIADDGIEVFGTRASKVKTGRKQNPTWCRLGDSAACIWRGVGLFRRKTGVARYQHFLGRYQAKATFLEGSPIQEPSRMQFGLAALQKQALAIDMAVSRDAISIKLPLRPPVALRRLLVALCNADTQSFDRTWVCQTQDFLPALQASLQELECEVIHHE
ncbi:MAG: hypothetical protein FWD67_09965 [Betaproteobacteria bacterium]|nr:hypothetical protein [Betaproteobacteria bacterium]